MGKNELKFVILLQLFSKMDNTSNYTMVPISIETITELVSSVVMRYVSKSSIPLREKEDVEMAIIEKILKQKEKINAAFQNRSNIKTYYIAVINRMCCEVIRSENKHWYSVSDLEIEQVAEIESSAKMETEKQMIIKKEIKRLTSVLLLFNNDCCKTFLFLKFLFNIPIYENEIQNFYKEKFFTLRTLFNRDEQMLQADMYNTLAQITNIIEGKEVKGDAIRMWMNNQIDLILKRMNDFDESNHCRDSLKILIEMGDSQIQSTLYDCKPDFSTLKKKKDE